jgi:hypothetical protein
MDGILSLTHQEGRALLLAVEIQDRQGLLDQQDPLARRELQGLRGLLVRLAQQERLVA